MKRIFYKKGKYDEEEVNWVAISFAFIGFVLVISVVLAASLPLYNVWSKELAGKATLREAEWNRQVTIEEAKANLESERLNALAEVERAKGVSEANAIIGEGLEGNEAYLRYLWVKGLTDGSSEVIYVPTEANLPLLEATRRIQ